MYPHRFILQPYKTPASRFYCPQCQHRRKTFTRYIDADTGNELADHVGICDRTEKCGYHYPPRRYFAENPFNLFTRPFKPTNNTKMKKQFNTIPTSIVTESMQEKQYIHNNFVAYLAKNFGWCRAVQAAERYRIGTAKHWYGSCVFWQVDIKGHVRTGKIMLYDLLTGKRVKKPFNHIAWVHSLVGKSESRESPKEAANFLLQQCLFGEILLNEDHEATVCITESEKTAVIASLFIPNYIWLAAGSRNGLDVEKCRVLAGRRVILIPDVGCFDEWKAKARELNLRIPTATFIVHDELERDATGEERSNGIDWADRWLPVKPINS